MRCERGHSITFRDRGPGRIHMANHGKPMNSCRVQFVVRNMDTKDKTLQINSVECKISDTRRITNKISQIANPQQFGLFLSSKLSANCLQIQNLRQHSVNKTLLMDRRVCSAGIWNYDFLASRRFLSASKASRKWISTGDS